ncbi:universal stress protein UspA [Dictyobacter alpinus]|uniref:Universal stress protein UspA n=1 Tax=Dictyobacter alpinus TaxID=2014873 RepID=A0A402BFI8_9CHLR|nr:universal stress protein [Dictyobacter alpinus]GCE30155.1 universal stress protein UspA [Dictyobacter alpinus]
MFERIFVPLDGSVRAERALPIAARIARASHGKIILVCIVNHFILSTTASPVSPHQYMEEETWSIDDAEAYLQSLVDAPELRDLWTEKAVLFGPIAATLVNAAKTYQADLIVMCNHGHSGVTSKPLGSVAEKVVCRAVVPILMLREQGNLPVEPFADTGRPLQVLVALNGTSFSHAIFKPTAALAISLVGYASCILHLIRVTASKDIHAHAYQDEKKEAPEQSLSMTASDLLEDPFVDNKVAAGWATLEDCEVAEALTRIAAYTTIKDGTRTDTTCDVIAISSNELVGYQRLPPMSVTARVIDQSKLPIFFVYTPH